MNKQVTVGRHRQVRRAAGRVREHHQGGRALQRPPRGRRAAPVARHDADRRVERRQAAGRRAGDHRPRRVRGPRDRGQDRVHPVRPGAQGPVPRAVPRVPDGRDRVRPPRVRAAGRVQHRVRAGVQEPGDRHPAGAEEDRGARREHAARRQGRRTEAGQPRVAPVRQREIRPLAVPPPVRGRPEVRRGAGGEGDGVQRQAPDPADHAGAGAAAIGPPVLHRDAGAPGADEPPAQAAAAVPRVREGGDRARGRQQQGGGGTGTNGTPQEGKAPQAAAHTHAKKPEPQPV
jgi:hypothetical protein